MSARSLVRKSLILAAASSSLLVTSANAQDSGWARVKSGGASAGSEAAQAAATVSERGYLGVYMEVDGGAMVVNDVLPGSPAAEAGLEAGDRVVKIGKHKVKDMEGLQGYLSGLEAGKKLTIALERNGWEREVKVTLAGRDAIWTEGSGLEPPQADEQDKVKEKVKEKVKAKADDQGWSKIRKVDPDAEGWVTDEFFSTEDHDEHGDHEVDVKTWFGVGKGKGKGQGKVGGDVQIWVDGEQLDLGDLEDMGDVFEQDGKSFAFKFDVGDLEDLEELEGLGDRIRAQVHEQLEGHAGGMRFGRLHGHDSDDGHHEDHDDDAHDQGGGEHRAQGIWRSRNNWTGARSGGGADVDALRAEIRSLRSQVDELRSAMREVQELSRDVRRLIRELDGDR